MKLRNLLIAGGLGGAAFVVVTVSSTSTTRGVTEENPRLVEIINTPAAPVPTTIVGGATVSGAVEARQAGSWAVGAIQQGPWSVAVSNLPSVQDVRFAQPTLESGRLRFNIDVLGASEETVVPAGVVMTDLILIPAESGDFSCVFGIFQGVPSTSSIVHQPILTDRVEYSLHLRTGLEGPLTLQVVAGGLGTGRCLGDLFWTGYRL